MVMARFRSLLTVVLACVMVFVVSCSGPVATKPPTYTTTQIEQIQGYVSEIEAMRDRLPELATLIQKENWTFVKNFIRGPLGELRTKMSLVERNLLPNDQPQARETSKDLFGDLISIDTAAQEQDYKAAIRSYAKLQKDLSAFLDLAPKA